jgi:universal stress protein A
MDEVNRILVVSRSTKNCKEAVHYGVSLARKYGAELYILHVMHDPFSYEGWNLPIVSIQHEFEKMCKQAREEIDLIVQAEKAEGLNVKELIREGSPVDEIVKVVEEEKIDLLVLLAHHEWRLEHFLFGRTNEELMRRMPCSIVLVKKEPGKVS